MSRFQIEVSPGFSLGFLPGFSFNWIRPYNAVEAATKKQEVPLMQWNFWHASLPTSNISSNIAMAWWMAVLMQEQTETYFHARRLKREGEIIESECPSVRWERGRISSNREKCQYASLPTHHTVHPGYTRWPIHTIGEVNCIWCVKQDARPTKQTASAQTASLSVIQREILGGNGKVKILVYGHFHQMKPLT